VRSSNPHRCSQRGTAIAEFAIALPLLMFLLLATAEIGRLLSQYDTLTKSVRNGARYMAAKALDGSTGTVIIQPQDQTATQYLVVTGNTVGAGNPILPGLTSANITVASPSSGYISVSAAYTYAPMLGSTLISFGLTAPLNMGVTLNTVVVMKAL